MVASTPPSSLLTIASSRELPRPLGCRYLSGSFGQKCFYESQNVLGTQLKHIFANLPRGDLRVSLPSSLEASASSSRRRRSSNMANFLHQVGFAKEPLSGFFLSHLDRWQACSRLTSLASRVLLRRLSAGWRLPVAMWGPKSGTSSLVTTATL